MEVRFSPSPFFEEYLLIRICPHPFHHFFPPLSVSFMRGSWSFESGVYQTVTEVAIINSATDEANGVIALYYGEALAFELTDVVLRINESVDFSSFSFSCALFFLSLLPPH
jgi:hypothetical protein